jgi:hypothetical protein
MTAGQTAPKPLCNSSCPMWHLGPISNKIDSKFAPKTNLLYRRSEHCSQWCSEGGYDLRYKRFDFGVLVTFRLLQEWLFKVIFSHFGHTRLTEFDDVDSTKLYANLFFPPASRASNNNFNSYLYEFLKHRENNKHDISEQMSIDLTNQWNACNKKQTKCAVAPEHYGRYARQNGYWLLTTKDASILESAVQLDSRRIGHKKKGTS